MWTGNDIVQYGGTQTNPNIKVLPLRFITTPSWFSFLNCRRSNVPSAATDPTSPCNQTRLIMELLPHLNDFVRNELRFANPNSTVVIEDPTRFLSYKIGLFEFRNATVRDFLSNFGRVPEFAPVMAQGTNTPTTEEIERYIQQFRPDIIAKRIADEKQRILDLQTAIENERLAKVPQATNKVRNIYNGPDPKGQAQYITAEDYKTLCPNGMNDSVTASCSPMVKAMYKIATEPKAMSVVETPAPMGVVAPPVSPFSPEINTNQPIFAQPSPAVEEPVVVKPEPTLFTEPKPAPTKNPMSYEEAKVKIAELGGNIAMMPIGKSYVSYIEELANKKASTNPTTKTETSTPKVDDTKKVEETKNTETEPPKSVTQKLENLPLSSKILTMVLMVLVLLGLYYLLFKR